ncbi:putative alpha-ketoglutarate-dependent sulfonate dioxygenase [Daldinia childiae]|uniref:putative alpha-ketoglutarate-dependent sulfonate dioxygenase n=1 Tax=Daldinia childiae TaxID=326645 RepID=UPI0014456C88|nr:putative alpha-ketoglutarate-dependent sulfonate dioxygenase [Daldinia childiae]KAF3070669.1 putative alpha-ketoglutarate-dependent sulfonate dioxygenase [Daldinia childiae]
MALEAPTTGATQSTQLHEDKQRSYPSSLSPVGALEKFFYEETTPSIGREYPSLNIVDDLLNANNADDLIRDLAITISQRGVVFFRSQDNLTNDLQKQLVHRLGQLTGKPSDSTLHIHPILNGTSEFGVGDDQISTISSLQRKKLQRDMRKSKSKRYDSAQWHSDIQFEPVPADYTSLRLTELPTTGGDTLWASGYDIYDLFSKPYQKFFEGLTATFIGEGFLAAAAANPEKVKLHGGPRGNDANVGRELKAVHPVVRTNPVTGWKSIFAVGPFPRYINELSDQESSELLEKFGRTILENHELQVRFKWRNKNDLAIWDNRSAFHTATFDYDGLGERFGNRAVGIGEVPYFDPNSKSKAEALSGRKSNGVNSTNE